MKAKLLDTKTGATAESSGISFFQWSENNWSCDCNRELVFDHDAVADGTQTEGICFGCERYLVIEAEIEPGIDDMNTTFRVDLLDVNSDYPPELLKEHGIGRMGSHK